LNEGQATTLSEIEKRGEFIPPVVKTQLVSTASLSTYIAKDPNSAIMAREYREIFSRKDQKGSLYVNWWNVKKQKITCEVRLFNLDNRLLVGSQPKEITLNPDKFMSTAWEIPVGNMAPGVYRVDLVVGPQVAWREFFRVTE